MHINLSIGFISFLTSTLLFLAILILALIGQRRIAIGKPFFLLIGSTLIWSALLTMSQIGGSLAFEMVFIAELLRYYTWFYVLHHLLGYYLLPSTNAGYSKLISPLSISIFFIAAVTTLFFSSSLLTFSWVHNVNMIQVIWMLFFSILGIILVEQLIRNTEEDQRARVIYFAISAGAVFIYDFFVFSNAFLVQEINYEYWSARGFINVLIAPTLLISAARNPSLSPDIHISRQFVFHTTSLLGSGIYLVLMALAGYYIKINSGSWGELLQSTFLFAALLLFASLFFSNKVKLKLKQYVNRNFRNKYDYREEWNRFSNTLLATDDKYSLYRRSLQAVGQIVNSKGGQLWLKDDHQYQYRAYWHIKPDPLLTAEPQQAEFINFISKHQGIFSRQEFLERCPQQNDNPHWFCKDSDNWLILPLWVENNLFGYIHLNAPLTLDTLDHEDRELLTTITHHVALYLSQHEIAKELQRAEKFKSINQMTAFLTHDLKTLLSQLFLLVENGKIHKDNPAFIDDMLDTLEHVSKKMQRLVNQLKDPAEKSKKSYISVQQILDEIVADYKLGEVKPVIENEIEGDILIQASKNELCSALKHIIQNAVDSIEGNGSVRIELASNIPDQLTIKISDNGKGMTQTFIANQLFQPFESTKGVSGMGIGVYQSREYIRSLQGDIRVESQPAVGTTFTITLPLQKNNNG